MIILVINPGSTSTKIAVFEDDTRLFETVIRHSAEELVAFKTVTDQYDFRKEKIICTLQENGVSLNDIDVIACRGGATKKYVQGGTYLVTDQMCEEHRTNQIQHPASLAAIIGKELADKLGIEAYITDSPLVCEVSKLAEITGLKGIKRQPIFHALNSKAMARQFAQERGKTYQDVNVIVCHMGGGITVSCHEKGVTVDSTDALSGEGPMTPERTGSLPLTGVVSMCFSGEYTQAQMKKLIQGEGGIYSYLKTVDLREVEMLMASGSDEAKLLLDAMIYQTAKFIGAMATVVSGKLDAIILTGGIAYSAYVVKEIAKRCQFLAEVKVYPGEKEMEALAKGILRIKNGEEELKQYA